MAVKADESVEFEACAATTAESNGLEVLRPIALITSTHWFTISVQAQALSVDAELSVRATFSRRCTAGLASVRSSSLATAFGLSLDRCFFCELSLSTERDSFDCLFFLPRGEDHSLCSFFSLYRFAFLLDLDRGVCSAFANRAVLLELEDSISSVDLALPAFAPSPEKDTDDCVFSPCMASLPFCSLFSFVPFPLCSLIPWTDVPADRSRPSVAEAACFRADSAVAWAAATTMFFRLISAVDVGTLVSPPLAEGRGLDDGDPIDCDVYNAPLSCEWARMRCNRRMRSRFSADSPLSRPYRVFGCERAAGSFSSSSSFSAFSSFSSGLKDEEPDPLRRRRSCSSWSSGMLKLADHLRRLKIFPRFSRPLPSSPSPGPPFLRLFFRVRGDNGDDALVSSAMSDIYQSHLKSRWCFILFFHSLHMQERPWLQVPQIAPNSSFKWIILNAIPDGAWVFPSSKTLFLSVPDMHGHTSTLFSITLKKLHWLTRQTTETKRDKIGIRSWDVWLVGMAQAACVQASRPSSLPPPSRYQPRGRDTHHNRNNQMRNERTDDGQTRDVHGNACSNNAKRNVILWDVD